MKRFSGLELRSLSINTLTQFVVRIISSFATLTATLLIAYFMGLETVGSFTKVVAFVTGFYIIVDFGFNSMLLKSHFDDTRKQIGNLVVLRLTLALVLLPVITLLAYILPHNEIAGTGFSDTEKLAITIYSFTLIGVSLTQSLQAYMQRKLIYGISLFPTLISNSVLIFMVILAALLQNFYLLFTAYIFSWTTFAVIAYLLMRGKYELKLTAHRTLSFSKFMIFSSWPLALMLFFNFLYTRADLLLLSFFKPSTDVGIYGISYRFFEVAIALPTFLANSTFPILLKHLDNKATYRRMFRKYIKLYALLSFVALLMTIVGAPLIGLLKPDFSLSVAPLQILALSLPFFFLTSLLQWHFLIRNKLIFLVPLYAGALLLNFVLNIIFIPNYSYIASAIITGLCEGIVFLVMFLFYKKSNPHND